MSCIYLLQTSRVFSRPRQSTFDADHRKSNADVYARTNGREEELWKAVQGASGFSNAMILYRNWFIESRQLIYRRFYGFAH
jgi:aminoglycoside phosphotransferase (APT) family kinase protein